jgi:hypothetical protein
VDKSTNLRFVEVQYSRQPWLWAVILISVCATVAIFGYLVIEQVVFGRPAGSHAMSNPGLLATGLLVVLFDVGLVALFLGANLRTEVRQDGLYIRYRPLHLSFHRLPLEDVVQVQAVTYHPLLDYGGWGIRYARRGKAYNPMGNRGVRLDYRDGRHILIGSQRPDELAAAIRSVLGSSGASPGARG